MKIPRIIHKIAIWAAVYIAIFKEDPRRVFNLLIKGFFYGAGLLFVLAILIPYLRTSRIWLILFLTLFFGVIFAVLGLSLVDWFNRRN